MKDYGKDYKMKTNMMVYRRRGISFEKNDAKEFFPNKEY
jgi:hypothetical protein